MTLFPTLRTRIAAFFDIDGTLLPAPSLERRMFAALRNAGAIQPLNYVRWLIRAAQATPTGIAAIANANKKHLRAVPMDLLRESISNTDTTLPCTMADAIFFPDALAQAAWHAELGHAIVLVSGTLAPLAHRTAVALTMRLAARNVIASIGVCATRLEEIDGRLTGEIAGEAIFGPAKARVIHQIAADHGLDLRRCYAYADSFTDRWMLDAVGRPAAVNPSRKLEVVARLNDWPLLHWQPAPAAAPRTQCRGGLYSRPRHPTPVQFSCNLEASGNDHARPVTDYLPAKPQTEPQQ